MPRPAAGPAPAVDAPPAAARQRATTAAATPAEAAATPAIAAADRTPRLSLRVEAPAYASTGSPLLHRIIVRNDGGAPAKDVAIVQTIPVEWRVLEVSGGGVATNNEVRWALGEVLPATEQVLTVAAQTETEGDFACALTASASGREGAAARTSTKVTHPAGLELEVVDLEDPIEVGQAATWVITVTNRGAEADSELQVRCLADADLSPITTTGDCSGRIDRQEVVFRPDGALAPGAKLLVRVLATGDRPGELALTVALGSKNLGARKVEARERTTFVR
jgi:hypothetical protein